MSLRVRLEQFVLELAMMTRLVALSLVLLHKGSFQEVKMIIAAMLTGMGALLMIISCGLYMSRRVRDGMPPIVYIILMAISVALGIAEVIIYALTAFDGNRSNEMFMAVTVYDGLALLLTIGAGLMIFLLPPLASETNRVAAGKTVEEGSVKQQANINAAPKLMAAESQRSNKPTSQRSQRSTKPASERSRRSSRNSKRSNRSQRSQKSQRRL